MGVTYLRSCSQRIDHHHNFGLHGLFDMSLLLCVVETVVPWDILVNRI